MREYQGSSELEKKEATVVSELFFIFFTFLSRRLVAILTENRGNVKGCWDVRFFFF